MASNEERCSSEQLALLALVDRLRRRSETSGLAIPHLDKDEAPGIAHDEIDFTAAATDVSRNELEPAGLEVFERQRLCVFTY